MDALNRQERQTLRQIQSYLQTALLDMQVVVEQLGTVDVYFHPTNPDPFLNCATPHKGVAWVRRDDLNGAFVGLDRLGRDPRLVFQDALFPVAFQQQLKLMGLYLENERMVMVYQPILGPIPQDEILFGCLPSKLNPDVQVTVAQDAATLGAWLRVFRAGYFNTDAVVVEPEMVEALVQAVNSKRNLFVLSHYQGTPLGAARVGMRDTTAELEAVVTTPLWHGMGLEDAMIATVVRETEKHGCDTVFTIQPPEDYMRVYRRLGFEQLTRVLTYRLSPDAEVETA
jgi:GNAT superfamily N-acetyltransferase